MTNLFHLAIPVIELEPTRTFYQNVFGCDEGRSSDEWVDFNFYGHQLVIHKISQKEQSNNNLVDGKKIPVPHFGIILEWNEWHALAKRLREHGVNFVVEPYIRFEGQVGEQATMFFHDPSENALEFKSFRDPSQIFAK